MYYEARSVGGGAGDAGGRALEPGVVVGPSGGDVQRRAAAVGLDAVAIVAAGRQHPSVLLPADHRHRHADRLGRELDRVTLAYRLILQALDEPRRRRHWARYRHARPDTL